MAITRRFNKQEKFRLFRQIIGRGNVQVPLSLSGNSEKSNFNNKILLFPLEDHHRKMFNSLHYSICSVSSAFHIVCRWTTQIRYSINIEHTTIILTKKILRNVYECLNLNVLYVITYVNCSKLFLCQKVNSSQYLCLILFYSNKVKV